MADQCNSLCANNCGFFGTPSNLNLCSRCFTDHCTKQQKSKSSLRVVSAAAVLPVAPSSAAVSDVVEEGRLPPAPTRPNRCSVCRKRVGLTGFDCRCGATCCGDHRYPEQHACPFDYKAAGREALARANPVVKADKLARMI